MLLLLDHRDSFTWNLVQALQVLGAQVEVRDARELQLEQIHRLAPQRIVLGPGPGHPRAAQLAQTVVRDFGPRLPILGVCLGHQAIGLGLGGQVGPARELVHGWTSPVQHDGRGIFRGLEQPLAAPRYHSLAVLDAGLPAQLEVSARAADGEIMALRHRSWPLESVQFHPESVLGGESLGVLANFLAG